MRTLSADPPCTLIDRRGPGRSIPHPAVCPKPRERSAIRRQASAPPARQALSSALRLSTGVDLRLSERGAAAEGARGPADEPIGGAELPPWHATRSNTEPAIAPCRMVVYRSTRVGLFSPSIHASSRIIPGLDTGPM